MKFIPSFGEIASKTKNTFKRFPITISWAIAGTLFVLLSTETESFFNSFITTKVILTFILGISWLIATRFFEEQFDTDKEWLMLISIGFLLGFYFHLPNEGADLPESYIIRFILYLIAGHLFVFVSPFLLKWDKSAFFNYLKSVFVAIVRSLLFSLILYLGIVLALLAVKHLFNIDIDGKRFFQIFIICLGTVNTWIYLSDFPKDIYSKITVNYTKPLEVLVKYILIPLVILYLIILYAYSLKIVINWNLPKGWVSYLVVALSLLGFIIQILINPIQKTIDSRPIRKFHPWFYILLLPLIMLLFVAIFRRINEYGFTENRYFVLTLALWILVMTLYMLFSKNKKIRAFPLTLAVIALVVSFGFWGAFSVSTNSQIAQFKKVFNEIKSTDFKTTFEKKDQLQSITRYLSRRKKLSTISDVLGYNPDEVFKDKNSWSMTSSVMDSLKISITNTDDIKTVFNGGYKYFSLDSYNQTYSIKNYDYFKEIRFNEDYPNSNSIKDYNFLLVKKTNVILISNEKKNLSEIIDLQYIRKRLLSENNQEKSFYDQKKLTLIESFELFDVKIVFMNLTMNEEDEFTNANGYVFIKEK